MLIAIVLFAGLLFALGDAITHVLRFELLDAGRSTSNRTADELMTRLSEEARCSTAVFVPDRDVFGGPNGGPGGAHEIDLFRRLAGGQDSFVAYRFDAERHDITRYDYSRAAATPVIADSDVVAGDIGAFTVTRSAISSASDAVGAADARSVTIQYGRDNVAGGNDIVDVAFETDGGPVRRSFDVHLAAKAAPTNLAVLVQPAPAPSVGPSPPAPSPGSSASAVIPFEVVIRNPTLLGGGGGVGLVPQQPQIVDGSATVNGSASLSWLEFSQAYGMVEAGTYPFKDSNGQQLSVSISCQSGACPQFMPLPGGSDGSRLVFKATN